MCSDLTLQSLSKAEVIKRRKQKKTSEKRTREQQAWLMSMVKEEVFGA